MTMAAFAAVPEMATAGLREEQPNQVTIEVAGRSPSLGAGLAYEHWFNDFVGVGAGLSAGLTCIECSSSQASFLYVPVYVSLAVPLGRNHGVSLSAGATFPLGAKERDRVVPSLGAGYQLLAGGFVLRPSFLLLFGPRYGDSGRQTDVMPWFGLQVGWGF